MSARLRPVPDAPLRVLGMIRVSKERDGMISPDMQRIAIEDYCRSRGYDIVDWVEGIDESGSRARSAWWRRLDEGVARVEDGDVDVLVVWKFSRTARHRLRWAVALDRVETAGGRLESATEQVDVTTSTGRFTRGMLAELNAFEAERIGEVWTEVHMRRVRDGKPASGKPRYGYVYDLDQKLHVPDSDTGPVLARAYERYVAGESVFALVRWLNSSGHRTLSDGLWSDRSLRRVMDSGFAAGKFTHAKVMHDGVHEPLISAELWQAYLDARETRRSQHPQRERSRYLLSGIVRCGRCGRPMTAGQFGQGRMPKYRCKVGKEMGPEACTGGYVMESFVVAAVLDWLREVADDLEQRADAEASLTASRVSAEAELRRLGREIERVDQTIQRLVLQFAEGLVPQSAYELAMAELQARRDALAAHVDEHQAAGRRTVTDPAATARGLLEEWDQLPVEHRRQLLGTLISRVMVWTGRPRATISIVSVWEASSAGDQRA